MNNKKLLLLVIVLLCAIISAFSQEYQIGDIGPGGGVVFYYSEEGFDVYQPDGSVKKCNYFEVAKKAIGKIRWCPCSNGCSHYSKFKTRTEIGYGKINTYNIVNNFTHKDRNYNEIDLSNLNCAAKACLLFYTSDSSRGEWFLPSKDELDLLDQTMLNYLVSEKLDMSDYAHWSSSAFDEKRAWCQVLRGHLKSEIYKSSEYVVRPIRAF